LLSIEAFRVVRSSAIVRIIRASSRGGPSDRGTLVSAPGRDLSFAALYNDWFDEVYRWLRALGAPAADREDLAQEVFLVVRRRLHDFDGRNVAGWLYQIARRQVLRHKRLRWVRRVLAWQPIESAGSMEDVAPAVALQGAPAPSPLAALETKERRALLERLMAGLSEKRRVVLVLFEVEGYTGEEIAEMLDVPINTVWTRLHHARRDFLSALGRVRGEAAEGTAAT
jgi:RNA polymerase sigma-70 factor, ECF subfamily